MSSLRFQLDLDRLGELIKADPNLIEIREYKDGTKHRMVKFSIMERKQPSDRGATHYIKADMYHKQEIQGVNYYLSDCYPISFGSFNKKFGGSGQQDAPSAPPAPSDDLPF